MAFHQTRREIMQSIRGKGNKTTELKLMALFKEHKITGWRRHQPLPGRPDFIFPRGKMAVFVDGCFWHQCPEHGVMPKANREWWRAKLEGNTERDRRKDRALLELGWLPFHVWEHEDVAGVASRIRDLWEKRIGSSWSPGRTDPPAFR